MTDLFEDFAPIIDRSTCESYVSCPMQARLKEAAPRIAGVAASIGEEGHKAIGRTITRALDGWDMMGPGDFGSTLRAELAVSRPDVQPQVIEAFTPCVWSLSEYFAGLTSAHVLRYDGGEGERCGQVAADIAGFRLTSELDFLHATQSREVLRELDWKSGRGTYDIDDVVNAFQFQVHAFLVLSNYEDVAVLEVSIWNTRKGQRLPFVQFPRTKLKQYEARIRQAIETLALWESAPLETVPCWASTEKCRICDVAARCPAVDRPMPEDDAELLRKRIATDAHLTAIDKELQARVSRRGNPIETPDGDCYGKRGAEKPRETWKVWTKGGEA